MFQFIETTANSNIELERFFDLLGWLIIRISP